MYWKRLSPKILQKKQKHENWFLMILKVLLSKSLKLGNTNKESKKIPIVWAIICYSSAIFYRVISFLRKI